jgi:hypothetical protein
MVVSFIVGALKSGYRFLRLRDAAELFLSWQENIPEGKIVLKKVMGGIGKVSCQEI